MPRYRYSFSVSQSNRATGVAVFFHSVAFLHIHQDQTEHTEPQPVRRGRHFYWWFRPWCFPGAWTLLRILQRHVNRLFYGFQRGVHVIGQQLMFIIISTSKDCQSSQRCEKTLIEHFFGIFNFISLSILSVLSVVIYSCTTDLCFTT